MQKDVFWKAAILTFVVLVAGIQLGIWIDSGRLEEIKQALTETDIQFSDARLQAAYLEDFLHGNGVLCDSAFQANLEFNDRIYELGKTIERFEQADRFNKDSLRLERQRYALLQMQFWMNAVRIRQVCNLNYTTVLYLYTLDTENTTDAELPQRLQSATLLELKERCGPKLMLSPVPVDLGLTSVDIVVNTYKIDRTPSLLINNKTVIKGLAEIDVLEQIVSC